MSNRPFTNREIQEKIAVASRNLSDAEIDKFCTKQYSKLIFDINFPLFLKVPDHFTHDRKSDAVKDEQGVNRWTWKYEFKRNGFSYAMSTQWYSRNDEYVQRLLRKMHN